MMAANHCLISIGVKKQSESQHCFAQIWRLVLWQFLQLLYCPWMSNTLIVQIGSGWESCGWSLLFWAPNPGFHVLHLWVINSNSPRRWPLCRGRRDAAQRNHGVPQLQQRHLRRGAPRIWVEFLGRFDARSKFGRAESVRSRDFSRWWCLYCVSLL